MRCLFFVRARACARTRIRARRLRKSMKINSLKVKDFRNLAEQEINFGKGLNVICGSNGAGKTNILEALHFCSIGRSPRTRKDGETVAFAKKSAEIRINYERGGVEREVGLNIHTNKGKLIMLDGVPSQKVSDIVGNFATVYFSPDEINIVRGGPQYRRRFMDIINCQIGMGYMNNLRNLQHALKQRNAILKSINMASRYDLNLLPWDRQISAYSIRVMLRRANFMRSLDKFASVAMRVLTDNKETLRITYRTFFDRLTDINVNTFDKIYRQKVLESYPRDVATKTTNVGAHLDDFEIKLGYIDETVKGDPRSEKYTWIPLRTAGSLGQQRTATLALKIAEMFLYKKYYGEKPTLLLDDVLSELDESRCRKLMEYCKTFDTIITCTEWNYPAVPDRLFKVNDGVVEELPIDPELKTRFEAQNVEAEKFEQAFEKAENEIENITE